MTNISGGHFNYKDIEINNLIDILQKDEYPTKEIESLLKSVINILHSYDWFQCGDTSEQEFIKVYNKEIKNIKGANKLEKRKLDKVFMECYRRMYKEAEPSGDIAKIIKSGEGEMDNFFMAYYLNQVRQDEIIEEVLKELKTPKSSHSGLRSAIILGSSPCSDKETTDKERKDYAKRLNTFLNTNHR